MLTLQEYIGVFLALLCLILIIMMLAPYMWRGAKVILRKIGRNRDSR
ncbi:hypothetical protein PP178_12420 [Zeaxanthinibacter sp. PT1]|nr:hypothetical protein [Zeaxanthinibacter sp. PT1]MDC6352359.1 hypothetical protein [Zeaxanthinibacter sp. PT1]